MLVYEFKLQGKPEQFRLIDEAIRAMQFVRNKALRFWMDNKGSGKKELSRLSSSLAAEFPWAKRLGSQARQAACERAWFSISRFFANCKSKKPGKKGYPRFQKDCRSVEYKQAGWKLVDGCRRLTLSDGHGIGTLKLLGNQPLNDFKDKIKRVRIIRKADGYYAQFCLAIERVEDAPHTGSTIGLDVGLRHFVTDSNGQTTENPKLLRRAERQLQRLQRRLSAKAKGSANRRKASNRLALKHLQVQRQRNDFATKLTRSVCRSHDLIAIEDLQVRNMVRNHHLAKSISDAGWAVFRAKLEYYARLFGKLVVAVRPHQTSQSCSGCGKLVVKNLSTRMHVCACGVVLDRDHNAALNIMNRGIEQLSTAGQAGIEACGEDDLYLDRRTTVGVSCL